MEGPGDGTVRKAERDRNAGEFAALDVDGTWWPVRLVDRYLIPQGYLGFCDHERNIIYIANDLPPDVMQATLRHEAIHAAARYLSEEAVVALDNVITDADRVSREVAKWST